MKTPSKYGFGDVQDTDAIQYMETAMENGTDPQTALADLKMVDAMLTMRKQHLLVHGFIRTTKNGYQRKGSSIYDAMNGIIDARMHGAFDQ